MCVQPQSSTHTHTPAHIYQYMSASRTHDMYMGTVSLLTMLALYVFLISIRSIQNIPVSPASNPDCRFQKQRGDRNKKKSVLFFSRWWVRKSYLSFALEKGRVQQRHFERCHLQPLVGTCLWGFKILVCPLTVIIWISTFIQPLGVQLLEEREVIHSFIFWMSCS